jgi:hypothetical protein
MSSFAPQNACQNTWTKKLQACSVNTHHLTVEDLPILTEEGKSMSVFDVSAESSSLGASGPFPVLQLNELKFQSDSLDISTQQTPSGVEVNINGGNSNIDVGVYVPDIQVAVDLPSGNPSVIWELRGNKLSLDGHVEIAIPDDRPSPIEFRIQLPNGIVYENLISPAASSVLLTAQGLLNGQTMIGISVAASDGDDYIEVTAGTVDGQDFSGGVIGILQFQIVVLARRP